MMYVGLANIWGEAGNQSFKSGMTDFRFGN